MAVNFDKIQLSSSASSNKVLLQDVGNFTVPALPGAGETFGIATIPHAYGNDGLIAQVTVFGSTVGNLIDRTTAPWQSNDGRKTVYASVDSSNLYIACISSDSSGLGNPSFVVQYTYRLLIP